MDPQCPRRSSAMRMMNPRAATVGPIRNPTKLRRAAMPFTVLSRSVTKILALSPKRARVHPREHVRQFEPWPRHFAPAHVIFARKIGRTISPITVNSSPRQFCDPGEVLNRDELTIVATRSFAGHCAARHVVADREAVPILHSRRRVAGAAIV